MPTYDFSGRLAGLSLGWALTSGLGACSSSGSSNPAGTTNDTTGSGGSEQANGGTGGSGGGLMLGAGGGAGAGGSAGSSGGAGGSGGASGSADAGADGASANATGCSSFPLCDTFESGVVGSPPSGSTWTLINNDVASSSATIDGIGAHGSSKSLKVVGSNRIWARNTAVIGTLGMKVHARFWVRFEKELATSHSAFVAMNPMAVDQYDQNSELRLGGQDAVFHWNNAINDHNVPPVSPNGDSKSFKPAAGTWYCVELIVDKPNAFLNVSVDSQPIDGLTQDGVPTADVDAEWLSDSAIKTKYTTLADFAVGWASYGAGGNTVWFDDVALSNSPIGCD